MQAAPSQAVPIPNLAPILPVTAVAIDTVLANLRHLASPMLAARESLRKTNHA